MTPGSVTINAVNGNETKSGAAGAVYDNIKANTPGAASGTELKGMIASRQAIADMANDIVAPIIQYIIDNGAAVIETSDSGLQRADVGGTPNSNTLGPSAKKTLAIE